MSKFTHFLTQKNVQNLTKYGIIFSSMKAEQKFVVTGDIHGRYENLMSCISRYENEDVQLVSIGDAIDAPDYGDSKKTVDLLLEVGAICVSGNHEWTVGASMNENEREAQEVWARSIWPYHHTDMLRAYGTNLDLPKNPSAKVALDAVNKLRDSITKAGHDRYFYGLLPYFEAEGFLAVHAGITSEEWTGQGGQKEALDISANPNSDGFNWSSEPPQIFDIWPYTLSTSKDVPNGFHKSLVTGHYHYNQGVDNRVSQDGRRIRLGSVLHKNAPLFIWESWSGEVVPIYAKA